MAGTIAQLWLACQVWLTRKVEVGHFAWLPAARPAELPEEKEVKDGAAALLSGPTPRGIRAVSFGPIASIGVIPSFAPMRTGVTGGKSD
jgi:hypothetical protein